MIISNTSGSETEGDPSPASIFFNRADLPAAFVATFQRSRGESSRRNALAFASVIRRQDTYSPTGSARSAASPAICILSPDSDDTARRFPDHVALRCQRSRGGHQPRRDRAAAL